MKKIVILFLLAILQNSGSANSDSLMRYSPLNIGLKSQFQINGYMCYGFKTYSIVEQKEFAGDTYYLYRTPYDSSWFHLDSTAKLWLWVTSQNRKLLYMDFTLNHGDLLGSKEITESVMNIYGNEVKIKGFKSGPLSSRWDVYWGYGLGIVYQFSTVIGGPHGGPIRYKHEKMSQQVFNDSLIFSHDKKTTITHSPLVTSPDFNLNLTANINHPFNWSEPLCQLFQYLDYIQLKILYTKGDSIIELQQSRINDPKNKEHIMSYKVDSTLLKRGYSFSYRIEVKERSEFPLFSYKPDSGYYKVEFTNLTDAEYTKDYTFRLYSNYPNPFNPVTKIKYSVGAGVNVRLRIIDVLGNEIANLVNEEKEKGEYEYEFDAVKYGLSSGVYFYQLSAGEYIQTKKMLILK